MHALRRGRAGWWRGGGAAYPVHVEHEDVERDRALAEAVDDLLHVAVGKVPPPRPPRAGRTLRYERHLTADGDEVAERALVVDAVRKEVAVVRVGVLRLPPVLGAEAVVLGVVVHRPAVARDDAPLAVERLAVDGDVVVLGAVEGDRAELVERLDRAEQVAVVARAERPRAPVALCRERRRGELRAERVGERELVGFDGELACGGRAASENCARIAPKFCADICAAPLVSDAVNFGTGSLRLTMASVARSSKVEEEDCSKRMSCGVSTVKRALPRTTVAFASATES